MSARVSRFVLVVAIVFAIMYWLQSRVTDQPMVQQEVQVNLNEIR
jgi:sensor domain CHASE-containing protein